MPNSVPVKSKSAQSRGMSAMLRRLATRRAAHALTTGALLFVAGQASFGASQTFSGTPVDTNLGNAANYVGGAAPGSITSTGGNVNNDVITFNTPVNPGTLIGDPTNPLTADTGTSNRTIGGIVFAAGAGAYQIGQFTGINLLLSTNQTNSNVTLAAGLTNPQILAAINFKQPSSTNGAYAFINNSTTTTATLTISSNINNGGSTIRPVLLTLSGSNTGANTISGVIQDAGTQVNPLLTKTGAGTWILTNQNVFTTTSATTATAGIRINGGTLVAANNQALGSNANANGNQVTINADTGATGGILQIANGITLDNGLSLNLFNGGTIQGVGTSGTNGRVNVNAAANATVTTTAAGDVFTLGNAANDLTGGGATSVLHLAGPGTFVLGFSNNLIGTVSLDGSGVVQEGAGATNALGTAALTFGAGSTRNLQLNGNNQTVGGLSTNGTTPGAPIIGNSGAAALAAAPNTLTVNQTGNTTYAGLLRDNGGAAGDVGTLALTKGGLGALTLTGANTYSGGTLIGNGTIAASNATAGSATGSGAVTVNNLGVLAGTGTAAGVVTVNSGGAVAPGAVGVGNIGTLTVGSLTLNAGSQLNFDLTTPPPAASDQIVVSTSGGLTINGGQLNINGGTAGFTTNGVYNLIGYTGAIGGAGTSSLSLNGNNAATSTNSYTFGSSGSFVTLTVASSGATINYYNKDANDVWSDPAAWSTGVVPNLAGAFAAFGGGGVPITANRTVTVDGSYTVGTISFNNPSFSYTLAAGTGANLTLDNGTFGAFITDTAGSHTVASPITMVALGATASVVNAGDTLTLSGPIGGTGTAGSGTGSVLTKSGAGTLNLTGNNTYTGGTNLSLGTIQINSANSLGDIAGNLTFGNGTLGLLADVTTTRNYIVSSTSNAVINANGHTLTQNGTITAGTGSTGGLTINGGGTVNATTGAVTGGGTVVLGGINTYNGATTVNAGTISFAANTALGVPANGSNLNLTNATVITTGNVTLNNGASGTNDVPVSLGGITDTFTPATGTTLTISGVISGSANIIENGAGTLNILEPAGGQNNGFTGTTLISSGTVLLGDLNSTGSGLGAGKVTLDGGTLSLFQPNPTGTASTFGNPVVVDTGFTGTLITSPRGDVNSTITGAGTLNIQTSYVRSQLDGNLSAFTGTINLLATNTVPAPVLGTNGGDLRLNNANGFGAATVNVGANVDLYAVDNFATTQTIAIGALTGVAAGSLGGGPTGGRIQTYSVGALNTSTEFDGVFRDGNFGTGGPTGLAKVGTGVLTLGGANVNTGGISVNAGTLQLTGVGTLGAITDGVTFTNTGANSAVVLDLNGTTQTVGVFGNTATTGLNTNGTVVNNGTGTVTFTIGNPTAGTNGTFIGTIADHNNVGGTGVIALAKNGLSTETLSGTNTYSGGTTVNQGTLSGTVNSFGAGPITTGTTATTTGTLDITQAANGTLANTISGDGILSKGGNATSAAGVGGYITVTGTNTYTGGTVVNAGTLSGGASSFGSGPITVNTGAVVDYSQATPGAAANNITGTGSVTKGGNTGGPLGTGGTLTYTGVDSAANTTVNAGTLLLNNTSGGALTGPVAVATGGTLGLGSDNQTTATANVTLAGGTLAANGHNDGAAGAPGLGTLLVAPPSGSASTLDFGDPTGANANTLAFSDSSTLNWTGDLNLVNYTDGADKLYIGATNDLTATQLGDIKFAGFIAGQDATGKITFAPAPEPSGWASMIIGMGVLGGIIARRRKMANAA